MITLGFAHLAHAASTAVVLHLPERAKATIPTLLTLAGFTPLQIEVTVTGFALFAQALIFAALRFKTSLPDHVSFLRPSVGR